MAKIKKLFLALLIIIFSSSCIIVYQDYPRRQNIRYHYVGMWGGLYNYYWSNLWYTYRYMRYSGQYSYQNKKTRYVVHKSSLQKPANESSTTGRTTTQGAQAVSSESNKTSTKKGKVKKK